MFGPAIKADFMFKQFTDMKQIIFPRATRWVNLNNMETFVAQNDSALSRNFKTSIDKDVLLFQVEGTIVPMQDTKSNPISKIEDLRQIPLSFSAVLNQNKTASGLFLIEGGSLSDRAITFGQISV